MSHKSTLKRRKILRIKRNKRKIDKFKQRLLSGDFDVIKQQRILNEATVKRSEICHYCKTKECDICLVDISEPLPKNW